HRHRRIGGRLRPESHPRLLRIWPSPLKRAPRAPKSCREREATRRKLAFDESSRGRPAPTSRTEIQRPLTNEPSACRVTRTSALRLSVPPSPKLWYPAKFPAE